MHKTIYLATFLQLTNTTDFRLFMMQMEMAGVASEGAAIQRQLIGRVFRDVLTQDQVSAWVLGLTGRSR